MNYFKTLTAFIPQVIVKIIKKRFGMRDDVFLDELLFQIPICNRLYQFHAQNILRADSADLLQRCLCSLQNALEGFETRKSCLGNFLAVSSGSRQCQQHLDHFIIVKTGKTGLQKLVSQPPTVSFALMPKFLRYRLNRCSFALNIRRILTDR